jgi:transposase
MRKSINGLSIVVSSTMNKNPTAGGELFLFYNKNIDKIKILYWDRNGFCLWYKRLEKGTYKIPKDMEAMSYEQLRWLLDGLDIQNLHGNKKLTYQNFY